MISLNSFYSFYHVFNLLHLKKDNYGRIKYHVTILRCFKIGILRK